MSEQHKDTNPKDALGAMRAPLHLIPLAGKIEQALAHAEGGAKYGMWNYAALGVRASVYIAAISRHVDKFAAGEDHETVTDPETGEVHQLAHHLGYAMAGCAIVLEARARGLLVDDRAPALPAETVRELFAGAAARMRTIADSFELVPGARHWTIDDTQEETK